MKASESGSNADYAEVVFTEIKGSVADPLILQVETQINRRVTPAKHGGERKLEKFVSKLKLKIKHSDPIG